MLDEENAVEMIDLVAEGAGQEVFAADFEGFTLGVLRSYCDELRSQNVAAKTWNGETAFLFTLFAFGVNDFRVGEDDFCFGIFSARDVDHGDAEREADLRRGEPDPGRGIHGGEHIFGELLQFGIEVCYRRCRFFEDWVAILDDWIDLARSGNALLCGGLRGFTTRRFVGHSCQNSAASRRESLLQIFAEKHRRAQGQPLPLQLRLPRGLHTSPSARRLLARAPW